MQAAYFEEGNASQKGRSCSRSTRARHRPPWPRLKRMRNLRAAPSDRVVVGGVQRAMPGAVVEARATTITNTAELEGGQIRKE